MMKRISLFILMCLLACVGAWAETLKGKVIDQDARPVDGAIIQCLHYTESDSIMLASTVSDADGNWELNYEHTWQDIQIKATKEGHTSYTTYLDVSMRHTWPKFIFRLINALDYEAGKRSTIYLPVAPHSSWGRFYRLDREEENKVIFERELTPKAYVPYVFFPDQDLHIDISGMDLFDHKNRVNLQRISFSGQINYMASEADPGSLIFWLLDESLSYVEYSEEGANEDSGFLPPMHAILSWMYYTWNGYTWNGAKPELVFHDPEIIYRPFIEDGKMWRTVVINQNEENSKRFYEYWIHNNSYIDGQKFVKISRSEFNYDIDKNCPMSLDTTYIGMLFEKDGKVLYATDDQSNEDLTLLYDFISPVGSEIEVCGDVCSITYKEKCQDEVFKGEKTYVQRKSDGTTTCWLEAVGTTSNPLGYALNADPMATEQELLISCTVGDEVLYYNGATPDVGGDVKKNWLDFTHTVKTKPKAPERDVKSDRMKSEKSNDDFEANNEDETVTGDYSVKELFVNFKTLAGPYTITVTDAAGQPIYNKVVQTSNVVALNTDISSYPKGEYTITVENEEEMYTAEFNFDEEDGLTPNPSPVGEGNYVGEGEAGAVYDLSGRRIVNHKSETLPLGGVGGGLSKGIYIIDGRKVVVK